MAGDVVSNFISWPDFYPFFYRHNCGHGIHSLNSQRYEILCIETKISSCTVSQQVSRIATLCRPPQSPLVLKKLFEISGLPSIPELARLLIDKYTRKGNASTIVHN
jgi:hypothetical protein